MRVTSTRTAWPGTDNAQSDSASKERARGDFALRPGESGLSLYEYSSNAERELAIAGFVAIKRRVRKVDYVSFDRGLAESIGEVSSTPGDTPIPKANLLHRELLWDQERLHRLADLLFERKVAACRVEPADVKLLLRKIDPADATDQETRAWLRAL
jgi:hypothetical protein